MIDNPLIIFCPIIGAELTRKEYPYLPITPDEIAEAAHEAFVAGACVIHLHVRDEKGEPTQKTEIFKKVSEKIKQRCDAILEYSTGGAVGILLEQRCAPLGLKPEMASLSMGTMNFGQEIFENSEHTIHYIADKLKEFSIMPDLEIFDFGMLDAYKRYVKQKVLTQKLHINFVMGVPGGIGGDLRNLVFLVDRLDPEQTWSVAGIGRFQLPLAVHAIAMGGHVRVGIEDNIYFKKGELAKSNAQLITRIVNIAKQMDRPIASVKQAREILGLL